MEDTIIRLNIERMTYGTDAIAHTDDGKTVFVAGAVAGDVVDVQVVRSQKTFANAIVTAVVEPSPARTTPTCPYSSVCGGCPWSHLLHEAQLDAKRANVVDAMVRIGHMEAGHAEALVAPCEAPSKPWGYRNKVELAFSREGRHPVLGMHATEQGARKTGKAPSVIKVDACPLMDTRYKKLVKSVSGALGYVAGSANIELERVGIRASSRTKDVEIALWTSPGSFPRAQVAKVIKDATKATSVVRVLSKGPIKARKVSVFGASALQTTP